MSHQECQGASTLFFMSNRVLGAVERLWVGIAGLAVIIMMTFTALDVLLRYGFNAPLTWWYDFLMNYVLTAAFFLPFSHTLAQHAHLAVEYFQRKLNARLADVLLAIGFAGSAAALAVVTVTITAEAYTAWLYEDVIAGVILWPVWPARAIVAVAILPLAARCLYFAAAHLARSLSHLSARRIPGMQAGSRTDTEALA